MREMNNYKMEPEKVNVKAILAKYLKHWYLFLGAMILCLGAAFIYVRYTTPVYMISSTLLLKDDVDKSGMPKGEMFSELDIFQTGKNVDNEIYVLMSKSLMYRVVDALSLQTAYYMDGQIKSSELYGSKLPIKVIVSELQPEAYVKNIIIHIKDNNHFELQEVDNPTGRSFSEFANLISSDDAEESNVRSTHKFGQEIRKPYGVFTVVAASGVLDEGNTVRVAFRDPYKVAMQYNNTLVAYPLDKNVSVLAISLTDPVPEKGQDVIRKLVEVYNKEAVEDKKIVASNTMQFIDERLKYLMVELTDVEKDVEKYKRKNEITDVSAQAQQYMQKAGEYNKQLSEFEIQIDVLQSIEQYLSKQENRNELVPSTLNIQDPTLLGLIAKFNELQLERKRMLQTTQPNNPMVLNINDQLNNLRVNILENLRNIKNGLAITKENLKASYAQFESRIQKVPSIERDLLEINRQQGVKQELYLFLLQKREESAMSLAATISNMRVIDEALVADNPVRPKTQLIYILAFVLGLGLPVGWVYGKGLLNDKVTEREEVERMTATPILGEIARSRSKKVVVVTENSRTAAAELFRLVRANLQFATGGRENKVILVTSSMSGEGKTFFSLNLGASLVLTGKRVVVLGFDLRKPGLMNSTGLSADLGISNYLISDVASVDEIILPSGVMPDLYIVGVGPMPPNPSELMLLPSVGKLIEELKERFDYVILDTAPVGQVADAFALAPYIDSSIFMVRYNYTYKEQLKIVDDIYRSKKFRYPMIVLNDAKTDSGYGYGYGYGYGDEGKTSWRKRIKQSVGV